MPTVPKRRSERIRRNKDEPVTTIHAVGSVVVPELGIPEPHELTTRFWAALHESAQSKYFEASDWWKARLTAHVIESYLRSSRPSSLVLGEINKMCGDLLVTEADRRRLRIEVERAPLVAAEVEGASASYKRVFGMEAVG